MLELVVGSLVEEWVNDHQMDGGQLQILNPSYQQ